MPSVQGFRGSATISGVFFTVHRWSVDWRADVFDATNMNQLTPLGRAMYRGGIMDVDISLDMFHETTDDPFNPALTTSVIPGTFLTAVVLDLDFGNVVTTVAWAFTRVLVVSAREDVSVRDITRISVMGKYTVPRIASVNRVTAAGAAGPLTLANPF